MSASFKVDISWLKRFADKFSDPKIRRELLDLPRQKSVAALVGQAIADNFAKQGPGWKPLKLRQGMILQKTNTLMKSVTTPGARGNIYKTEGTNLIWGTSLNYAGIHQRGGTITPKKAKALFIPLTKKAEKVGPLKDKNAQKKSGLKFGKDFVFAQSVTIPARPFLKLSEFWKQEITKHIYQHLRETVMSKFVRGV